MSEIRSDAWSATEHPRCFFSCAEVLVHGLGSLYMETGSFFPISPFSVSYRVTLALKYIENSFHVSVSSAKCCSRFVRKDATDLDFMVFET